MTPIASRLPDVVRLKRPLGFVRLVAGGPWHIRYGITTLCDRLIPNRLRDSPERELATPQVCRDCQRESHRAPRGYVALVQPLAPAPHAVSAQTSGAPDELGVEYLYVFDPDRNTAALHPHIESIYARLNATARWLVLLDRFLPRDGRWLDGSTEAKVLGELNDDQMIDALAVAADVRRLLEGRGWEVRG